MSVSERPENWPFETDEWWGQDKSALQPWDQVKATVTEQQVFDLWCAIRQRHGSEWFDWRLLSEFDSLWFDTSATIAVLVRNGWVKTTGGFDDDPYYGGMWQRYRALSPEEATTTDPSQRRPSQEEINKRLKQAIESTRAARLEKDEKETPTESRWYLYLGPVLIGCLLFCEIMRWLYASL